MPGLKHRADREQLESSRLTWSKTMPETMNNAYYRARAGRLAELADNASDPEIAAIHRRMAKSYRELAELTARNPALDTLDQQ